MRKITLFITLFVLVFSFTYGQKSIKELEKGVSFQKPKEATSLYGSKIPGDFKQKAPLSEDFENDFPPFGWWIDLDGDPWDQSDQTGDHTTGDGLFARYDCFNISSDESSGLVLPTLNPTSGNNTLSFWVNYYEVNSEYGSEAELYVDLSDDFGEAWTEGETNIIADSAGAGWFEYTVDLSSYNGEDVTVRLRAVSDYGGYNIGVDDVTGPEKYIADNDAGISSVEEPEGLLVTDSYDIDAVLTNYGSNDLASVDINTSIRDTVNNSEVNSYNDSWSGTLATAESEIVNPASHNFSNFGVYNIITSTDSPNGSSDPIFTNDQASKLVPVIAPGMLYDDFESGEFASGWTAEEDWAVYSGSLMHGDYFAGIAQQDGDPARKLITPQLSVQSGDEFIFLLGGNLNEAGASNNLGYSTMTVKYASSPDGDWTELQTFDMADQGDDPHYVSVDLSSVESGDYYFAFETVSDFSYAQDPSLGSYVFIDGLMGPVKTGTPDNDLEIIDLVYQRDLIYEGGNAEIKAVVKNVGLNEQTGNTVTFKEGGSEIGTADIGTIKYLEKDTVSVTWTATSSGKYSFTASLASDDNPANNDGSIEGLVVEQGQLAEGFEDSASIHQEWTYDEGWYHSGSKESTFGAYEGDSLFTCDGNVDAGTYNDVKLISPKLQRDQHFDKFYFYAKAVNTSDTTETTIQLNYTQDTASGSWSAVSSAIDLSGDWQLIEADLSSVPYGDVFFALSASTNWELQDYVSYVMIDHVVGVSYPRPEKQGTMPYDGDDAVALDSTAFFRFDEEVSVNDLSGVSISGAAEGDVSNVSAALQSDNKTLEITHDPYANNNEEYTVTIPYNAVENNKNAGNLEQSWSFTTIMAAPEAEYYYPDTSAEGIALDEDVLVRVNQNVTEEDLSGVTISGATEGTVGGVSASLDTDDQTINIAHDDFANMGEEYTVTIPAGAISNADGVTNEEISWAFTTRTSGQPVADTLLPNNNSRGVALDSVVYLVFDMAVTEGDLTGVDILDSDSASVSNVSATLINANSGDNDTLVINHDDFTKYGEYYTVNVPAGAVIGEDPNAKITWQFMAMLPPPEAVSFIPADQETTVDTSQTVKVEFGQQISENDFSGIQITDSKDNQVNGISPLTIGDYELWIQHDGFEKGKEYTVTIPADVVINNDGITNEAVTPWSFTTEYPKPEPIELNPADGSVEQPISGEISAKFNTLVDSVNFSGIELNDSSGNSVDMSPYYSSEDTTINIPYESLDYGMEYTVVIPAGTVENQDGILNDEFSWVFTTKDLYNVTFSTTYHEKAIEGVEVIINDNGTLITNEDGVADTMLVNGTYDYITNKEGYKNDTGSVTVDGADVTKNIALSGAYNLTFEVADEQDSPVENAEIYINTDEDTLTTDAEGVAVLENIRGGNYDYTVTDGNLEVSGSVEVTSDETVNVKLAEYSVSFAAAYQGNVVEGVEIAINNDTITTDADGKADIKLSNGSYKYEAQKPGYEHASGEIAVDGANLTEEISLIGALTITFNVEEEDGNAIDNANIFINTDEDTLSTNSDGVASLENIPYGSYQYEVSKDDYESSTGSVELNEESETVEEVNVVLTSSSDSEETGIEDFETAGISIYPNPSKGKFFIEKQGEVKYHIQVVSITGSVIVDKKFNDSKESIDISNQADGLYFIRLQSKDKTVEGKLLKQ